MAASVLPDVEAPHHLPRSVFQPVVYHPQIADNSAGIQIQVAMAPQAVSGPVAPRPLPTLRVRAATAETQAPKLVDAALVSDRADDQARQPPPPDAYAYSDPDADPGPPDDRWDDRLPPPPPDADYGDRGDYDH